MSKDRKPMTPEQKQECAKLRALWDKKAKSLGLTQEKAGAALGMTQGAVSHFLNGLAPLSINAVLGFAELLNIQPSEIRPTLRVSRDTNMIRFDEGTFDRAFSLVDRLEATTTLTAAERNRLIKKAYITMIEGEKITGEELEKWLWIMR